MPMPLGSKHAEKSKLKTSKAMKRAWKDPKLRKKWLKQDRSNFNGSDAVKARWADPKFHAKMCKVRKEQGQRDAKENSERVKALWQDPEYRARVLAARAQSKKYNNRSKAISKGVKKAYKDSGRKVWNKGFTKETHKSLAKTSKKMIGRICSSGKRRWQYTNGNTVIVMRSSWEVAFAYWLDSQKLKWKFEPRFFNVGKSKSYKGVSYTPDFWVPKWRSWIEIKGLNTKEFKAKLRKFKKLYPDENIIVLYGKDLHDMEILVRGRGKTKARWKKEGCTIKKLRTLRR